MFLWWSAFSHFPLDPTRNEIFSQHITCSTGHAVYCQHVINTVTCSYRCLWCKVTDTQSKEWPSGISTLLIQLHVVTDVCDVKLPTRRANSGPVVSAPCSFGLGLRRRVRYSLEVVSTQWWTHWSIFQPVLHDWYNEGCGMCHPICWMVHIRDPLQIIKKRNPCSNSSMFPLSLFEWSFTIYLTAYIHK